MTVTQAPWVWIVVLSLALFGVWFLATQAWRRARQAIWAAGQWLADWTPVWRAFTQWLIMTAWCRIRRQVPPPWWEHAATLRTGDDEEISDECRLGAHWECEGCWCPCGHSLKELPPERTQEDLGFSAPRMITLPRLGTPIDPRRAERERLTPWWEAQHRAAYESLGFDYPSGLMARVREQA